MIGLNVITGKNHIILLIYHRHCSREVDVYGLREGDCAVKCKLYPLPHLCTIYFPNAKSTLTRRVNLWRGTRNGSYQTPSCCKPCSINAGWTGAALLSNSRHPWNHPRETETGPSSYTATAFHCKDIFNILFTSSAKVSDSLQQFIFYQKQTLSVCTASCHSAITLPVLSMYCMCCCAFERKFMTQRVSDEGARSIHRPIHAIPTP